MTLYYETQNRNSAACDFGGNATLNTGVATVDAEAAAESCISNPSATFVPGGSSSTTSGSGRPTGTGSGGNSGSSVSLMESIQSLGLVMGISAVGAVWTLLA